VSSSAALIKGQFGIVLDRHYMVGVDVPGMTTPDARLAEQPKYGVSPVLVLWSFAKTHDALSLPYYQ
jgi:hypothetical protein